MRQFFQSRRLRYQILLLIEGRWEIAEVVDDGRDSLSARFEKHDYEALEKNVEQRARAALLRPGAQAVKVIRERILNGERGIETEILKLDAPPVAPSERLLGNFNGDHPFCEVAEDLLFRPALRSIGLLLRPFLDRFDLTAVELVTLKATNRRLLNIDRAINEAVVTTARQQATGLKIPVKPRTNELENFVRYSFARLRSAEALANPPKIDASGLAGFLDSVARRIPAEDQRFWRLRGLSHYVVDSRYGISKLELILGLDLLSLAADDLDPIDEVIAALVDQSETVKQLLGSQPNLKSALVALTELIGGAVPTNTGVAEAAAPFAMLLSRGMLPKTQNALWERVVRSLSGNQRLSDAQPKGEWAALTQLKSDLLPALPPDFLAAAETALGRRETQARMQLLGRG